MFDKILIATDGSLAARTALVKAAEIARASHAELIVVNVTLTAETHWGYAPYGEVSSEKLIQIGQKIIDDSIEGIDLNGIKITTKVRLGNPELEILDEAKSQNVDLIVVGSKGAGMLKGALLGSVANKLLKLAPYPVLLVKDSQTIRELEFYLEK